jgi:hypothetical protein
MSWSQRRRLMMNAEEAAAFDRGRAEGEKFLHRLDELDTDRGWQQLVAEYYAAEAALNRPRMKAIHEQMKRLLDPESGQQVVSALGMPDRSVQGPAHLHWMPSYAMTPDATCKGCGIPESHPAGAGPFENGLCRYCAALKAQGGPLSPVLVTPHGPVPVQPGGTYKVHIGPDSTTVTAVNQRMRRDEIASTRTAVRYVFKGDDVGTQVRLALLLTTPVWGFALVILTLLLMAVLA